MIKFRASQVGKLMGLPKTIKDQKAGLLSKTAQTYVQEVWLQKKFGYRENVTTKYMDKGLTMEDDSIALLSDVDGKFYTKNIKYKANEYLTGTCDINDDKIKVRVCLKIIIRK